MGWNGFYAISLNFGGSFLPYPYYKLTDGRSYSTFGSWLQLSFSELVCKTRFSGPKWRFSARPVLGQKNSKSRQVRLKKVVAKTQKYQKHKNLTENCPSSGRKLPPKLSHIAWKVSKTELGELGGQYTGWMGWDSLGDYQLRHGAVLGLLELSKG